MQLRGQDFAARACKVWKSVCAVAASQNGWNCSASISVWTYRCVCYLRWQLQGLCRLLAGNHTNLLRRNRYVAGEEFFLWLLYSFTESVSVFRGEKEHTNEAQDTYRSSVLLLISFNGILLWLGLYLCFFLPLQFYQEVWSVRMHTW